MHIYTTFDSLVGWADLLPGGRRDELPPGPDRGSASDSPGLGQNEGLVASSASTSTSSANSETGHGIGENKGVAVELEIISDTSEGKGMRSAMRTAMKSAMPGYEYINEEYEQGV